MPIPRSFPRRARALLVAVAVVAMVVAVVLVVTGRQASTASTASLTAPSQVSALSPARQAEIVQGCGRSWNGNSSATGELYNFVGLPSYGWALIYAPGYSVVCELNGEGGPYNAGGGELTLADVARVDVPYQIDHDTGGIRENEANAGGFRVVAGRVAPGVESVRITLTDRVASARTSKGTFLICFNYSDGDWLGSDTPRVEAFTRNRTGEVTAVPSGRAVPWR